MLQSIRKFAPAKCWIAQATAPCWKRWNACVERAEVKPPPQSPITSKISLALHRYDLQRCAARREPFVLVDERFVPPNPQTWKSYPPPNRLRARGCGSFHSMTLHRGFSAIAEPSAHKDMMIMLQPSLSTKLRKMKSVCGDRLILRSFARVSPNLPRRRPARRLSNCAIWGRWGATACWGRCKCSTRFG